MNNRKIEGLVAAPFTPMKPDKTLNIDVIKTYYDFLLKNGVKGAFINGSTGEGVSLTAAEKNLQAQEWARCSKENPGLRIINLVGGTSYRECIETAIASKELGIGTVAILGPYYFKPTTAGSLAEFCALVGEAVPELNVYYYHIPVLTGVNVPMLDFLSEITNMLPNFAGIKFTQEDLMDFQLCMNFREGKYDMLWGRDECMLSALAVGCRGFVGSTYNYAAPLYYKLIKAFDSGDMETARKLQLKSIEMIRLLGKYGGMATGKAYMRYVGLDCGEFRSPVKNMTGEASSHFRKDVEGLGMGEMFSRSA
jgi:N-acetylneuraminate lyase